MKFIALHARGNNDQKRLLSKEYVLSYLFLSGLPTRFAELKKPIGEKVDMSVNCSMISIAVSASICRELSISHRSLLTWMAVNTRQTVRQREGHDRNKHLNSNDAGKPHDYAKHPATKHSSTNGANAPANNKRLRYYSILFLTVKL
jgi:hypothetical protein